MPIACGFGTLVLLAVLAAAGPGAPVTAVTALPPPDTTAFGATGQLPDPTPVLPDVPPSGLPTDLGSGGPEMTGSGLGIPETVLAAYRSAATTVDRGAPGCRLSWPLVAGIGKVESGHASGGAVDADGTTLSPILGPRLTGTGGNAAIPDTDRGTLDHDPVWDRAVGPTQFIPSSWHTYGADGNGDGREDPDNVFDAGLATARYLCAGGGDLASADARHDAVLRYNHSEAYVATVLRWADAYASGALPVPDSTEPTWTGETLADGAPTLAALPEPSTAGGSLPLGPVPGGVSTAGGSVPGAPLPAGPVAGPAARPAPAGPVITSSGATRPGIAATRSPSSDLGLAVPAPALPTTGTTSSATGTTPPATGPASPSAPGTTSSSASTSTTPASSGAPPVGAAVPPSGTTVPPSGTTVPPSGTTTPSGTTAPPSGTTPPSSSPPPASAIPPPAKPAPTTPAPSKPAPSKPAPSKPASSAPAAPAKPAAPTKPSPTSTAAPSSAAPTPAARCTAAIPVAARALGVPAAQVTASSQAGPGAGRTTCTLRGP
ncbi:lytic transglycosylase domain-containing protein, partial [Actinomycetospora sp.]|uniref:lytic transglycosylase domain-containing protein n=1 Tax=Actinomycetospora sp. TaxID=1872135 RepID=UPI002F406AC9